MLRMRVGVARCITTAVLILSCPPLHAQAPPAPAAALGDSLRTFADRLGRFGVSGALLVARSDTVLVETGMGSLNDSGDRFTADTPVPIASISKSITAAAILMLEEEGRLSVSDTLGRFFPALTAPMSGVSLHEVLSHSAGLPYIDHPGMAGMANANPVQAALAVAVNESQRGTYSYSNPGYTILAGVIEQATGGSYDEYIRKKIFLPAGMTSSGFLEERERWRERTSLRSYSGSRDEGTLADFPPIPGALGSGSIVSTVGDMHRFIKALRSGRLMSKGRAASLFAKHVDVPGGAGYGYGWNVVRTSRGIPLVVHGGDLGGYNGEVRLYPDDGVVTIFLSNRRIDGVGYKTAIGNPVVLRIAGLPHAAPPPLASEPFDSTSFPAGDYILPTGGIVHLRMQGNQARAGLSGQDAVSHFLASPVPLVAAAEVINERSRPVVEQLLAGNTKLLRDLITQALPADALAGMMAQQIGGLQSQLGAPAGADVLGTAMRSPNAGTTAFRLRFERGDRFGQIGWAGDQILDIDIERRLPLETSLARGADGSIVAYNPFTGVATRMTVAPAADGEPVLTIRSATGATIDARRSGN